VKLGSFCRLVEESRSLSREDGGERGKVRDWMEEEERRRKEGDPLDLFWGFLDEPRALLLNNFTEVRRRRRRPRSRSSIRSAAQHLSSSLSLLSILHW